MSQQCDTGEGLSARDINENNNVTLGKGSLLETLNQQCDTGEGLSAKDINEPTM